MNYLPGSVVPFCLDENTYRNLRLLVAKTVRENIRPSHYYYQIVTGVRVSYGFLNVSGRFPFNLSRSLMVGSKYYSETAHRFLSTNREKARRQRIIVHSGLVSFAACMALGGGLVVATLFGVSRLSDGPGEPYSAYTFRKTGRIFC